MKKLQTLFLVAIATFLIVGNSYAGNVSIDLNSSNLKIKKLKNYTIDLNYTPPISTHTPKNSEELAATENVDITWLPNEEKAGAWGKFEGSGNITIAPVMAVTKDEMELFPSTAGLCSIKQINNIQFSINGETFSKISNAAIFIITETTEGLSFAVNPQIVEPSTLVDGWNTVNLTTPYVITSSNIETYYIGFYLNYDVSVSPFNYGTPEVTNKQNVFFANEGNGFTGPYNLTGGNFLVKAGVAAEISDVATDVNLIDIAFPDFLSVDSTFIFQGLIQNIGNDAITSLDVTYKMADATEVTFQVTGIDVKSGIQYVFKSPNITASNPVGAYPVSITITKVNAKDDEDMSNNKFDYTYSIYSVDNMPTKRVFGEECTGTWCGFCPRGWVYMEDMRYKYPNTWIGVAVHNQDPMVCTEYDAAILGLANAGGYPSATVDRTFDIDPNNFDAAFNYAINTFGVAELKVTNYQYNVETRKIDFDAEATFAVPIINKDIRFMAIITEDSVRGTASGYNQVNNYANNAMGAMGGFESRPNPVPAADMYYNDVARAVLGTPYGAAASIPTNIETNSNHTYHFTYTVPATYNYDNVQVIVVLLNNTSNVVLNTVKSDKISSIATEHPIINTIYPNPVKDNITLDLKENAKVTIWNIKGDKLLETTQEQGISNLKFNAPTGTYILRTENKNGSHTTKFVVE